MALYSSVSFLSNGPAVLLSEIIFSRQSEMLCTKGAFEEVNEIFAKNFQRLIFVSS